MHQMNLFAVQQPPELLIESSEHLCFSSDLADSTFGLIENSLKKNPKPKQQQCICSQSDYTFKGSLNS